MTTANLHGIEIIDLPTPPASEAEYTHLDPDADIEALKRLAMTCGRTPEEAQKELDKLEKTVSENPDDYHNPKPSPYDWSTRDDSCTERRIADLEEKLKSSREAHSNTLGSVVDLAQRLKLAEYDAAQWKVLWENRAKQCDSLAIALVSKERLVDSQQKVIAELYAQLHPEHEKTPPLACYPGRHSDWRDIVDIENGGSPRRK
jgi:hypothetical protein